MARGTRPVPKSLRTPSERSPARVTTYIDPSRVKPRAEVRPVIEGGTKTLTLQEQLGLNQPLVTNKKPSGRKRVSREDWIATILAMVAERSKL